MEASASTGLSADEELVAPDDYGVIVIDGGALIHSLPGTTVQGKTFDEYFTKVFCPRIQHELKRAARVDIVWDQYRAMSIKATTREKRGTGARQRVSASAKVPVNWQNFLANHKNKKSSFHTYQQASFKHHSKLANRCISLLVIKFEIRANYSPWDDVIMRRQILGSWCIFFMPSNIHHEEWSILATQML